MSSAVSHLSPEARASLPQHVAVIMDGNGRWAKQRGLPRIEGWRAPAHHTKSRKQLPAKAQAYLKAVAELTDAKLYLASVGPGRKHTISV